MIAQQNAALSSLSCLTDRFVMHHTELLVAPAGRLRALEFRAQQDRNLTEARLILQIA